MTRQPFLHDLVVTLAAPVQVWSGHDGEIDGIDIRGVLVGDHRVLSLVHLGVEDDSGNVEQAWLTTDHRGGGKSTFVHMLRVDADGADPLVSLTRTRTATPDSVHEHLLVASALDRTIEVTIRVTFVPDATPLNQIKDGRALADPIERHGMSWRWAGPCTLARLEVPDADVSGDEESIVATWRVRLEPNRPVSMAWNLAVEDRTGPFIGALDVPLAVPAVSHHNPALQRVVERSIADLNGLRLAERSDPELSFLAAGAPWFLTLFGRDSLIAARLLLPFTSDVALSTLRTLAERQGRTVDVDRAEAPGKILHEVRAAPLDLFQGTVLPPQYYGTIDATPLWICLLGAVWKAGVDDATIAEFTDPLIVALGWLAEFSDPDGDGFLEYFDDSGHGLANQGWKDSGDSVRFADGTIADGPIALAEVQGYAYQAARTGAELLRHFGRSEAERAQAAGWDAYADAMAARFRERFWVSDEAGPYPALALDAAKRPVTGVASNMGHLLITGMLNAEEEALIVRRLTSPSMFSGYGVRTMSSDNGAYWPARYHVGSVWTHDTAMAIEGMLATGYPEDAARLAEGLLRAAEGFGYQLPELFGGQDAEELFPPAPYPASCRPQAWAAASAITVATALGAL